MYDIAEEYFKWLCQSVMTCDYDTPPEPYEKLLRLLFNTSFYSNMEMDRNRAADGLGLRDKFASLDGSDQIYLAMGETCTVLEMLVALSMRIDHDLMFDIRYGNRTGNWFWLMIENLGLNRMDDKHYNENIAIDILSGFLDRRYGSDGFGGLFYVRNPKVDMRNLDIWYQMNAYFNENYFYWE